MARGAVVWGCSPGCGAGLGVVRLWVGASDVVRLWVGAELGRSGVVRLLLPLVAGGRVDGARSAGRRWTAGSGPLGPSDIARAALAGGEGVLAGVPGAGRGALAGVGSVAGCRVGPAVGCRRSVGDEGVAGPASGCAGASVTGRSSSAFVSNPGAAAVGPEGAGADGTWLFPGVRCTGTPPGWGTGVPGCAAVLLPVRGRGDCCIEPSGRSGAVVRRCRSGSGAGVAGDVAGRGVCRTGV